MDRRGGRATGGHAGSRGGGHTAAAPELVRAAVHRLGQRAGRTRPRQRPADVRACQGGQRDRPAGRHPCPGDAGSSRRAGRATVPATVGTTIQTAFGTTVRAAFQTAFGTPVRPAFRTTVPATVGTTIRTTVQTAFGTPVRTAVRTTLGAASRPSLGSTRCTRSTRSATPTDPAAGQPNTASTASTAGGRRGPGHPDHAARHPGRRPCRQRGGRRAVATAGTPVPPAEHQGGPRPAATAR